jgi:mannose-6-phosphate isomerase-like protein (cupin superfamily)
MSEPRVVDERSVEPETWSDDVRGTVSFRTIFGGAHRTAEFTAGVAELEPGGWLGHHRHEPAELYHVIEGEGILVVDGVEHTVARGSTAYIPGDHEHGIRNCGTTLLRVFYTFALGGSFDQIEYRFTEVE